MPLDKIFILDTKQEQAELLNTQFAETEYQVLIFQTVNQLASEIESDSPALCLLDYPTLLDMQREEVIQLFKQINQFEIAVYNVPQDATRRLAFYELGARRVYDSGHSLEELSYSIRWLMRAISDGDLRQTNYSHGDLKNITLDTLIPLLSAEQRSGILTIHAGKGSGKIYFMQGNILDAQTGTHQGEVALFQMMLWKSGKFLFLSRPDMEMTNRMMLSNFGLCNKGRQYRQKYNSLMDELALPGSVIRATHLGDLKMTDLNINSDFLEFILRPHSLEDLVENSFYTANETLEKLVLLNSYGFLIINAPVVQTTQEKDIDPQMEATQIILANEEMDTLKQNLNLSEEDAAKIVVLSWGRDSRSEFISELGGSIKTSGHAQNLDVSRVCINKELNIYLIGLELNQTAAESIAQMQDGVVGFIFIIDADVPDQFEYNNYVINQILTANPLSAVVAVRNIKEDQTVDLIREQFLTPTKLTWIEKPEEAKNLLLSISPFEYEDEEEESELEDEVLESETEESESENAAMEAETEETKQDNDTLESEDEASGFEEESTKV